MSRTDISEGAAARHPLLLPSAARLGRLTCPGTPSMMAHSAAAQVRALSVLLRHISDGFGCDQRVAAAAIQLCAALAAALPSKSSPGLGFGLTGLPDGGPEAEDAAAVLPLLARAGAVAFARAHADARADGCAEASADARARWTAELDGLSVALVRWLHSAVLSGPAERRTLALMTPAEVGPCRTTPCHAGSERHAPARSERHRPTFRLLCEGRATAAHSSRQRWRSARRRAPSRRQVDGFGAAAVQAGSSARADDAEEEGKEEALGLHVIRAVCALAMVCPAVALDTLVHSSLLVHVLMDAV